MHISYYYYFILIITIGNNRLSCRLLVDMELIAPTQAVMCSNVWHRTVHIISVYHCVLLCKQFLLNLSKRTSKLDYLIFSFSARTSILSPHD